ncbi:MAG: hypothetical protein EZS28_004937 [Streblomastix strix]|uniref:Uncharacterized protein n=1 Tax=Streblomastix strix TaxID=222440 RepID=A0A5J4WYW1_9EUKA|nr:MAG: hypothetical protein EZS28_004937 [Streblomastix strix]
MNTWIEDQETVAKLVIGDNLYIVDKQVMDYWWDGSSLRGLETELPDMSNVMTILGAATGGGNAIIYLLFDGNILISAKNSSFITTNYDETITGQKPFNKTIHSVGISTQNYENNSVLCTGGGVKSIQNINASVDFSNYYNKSQAYSQTETDQKLNQKLNISDQIDAYTQTQDDALLLLKADKTELIDSFNKPEVDALLDDKLNVSDQIDAYTKTQDDANKQSLNDKADSGVSYTNEKIMLYDALLLLKADKTQLIHADTKGEANNLLSNKANSGVSYIKGEDDALLLLKADKTQLIDAYTKIETNNLLNNNADSRVSYSKQEDDALLLLKANQSTTYIKIETDQIISQIAVGDVDFSGYMILCTSLTITANKTFNNAYRFVSSIDVMATIISLQLVKSGADDSVVLLGAGGTKPLSEFTSGSVDDSNYVKKMGQELQIIHGVLRRDDDELSMSEYDEDYLTIAEIYNAFVSRYDNQTICDTKTFNSNVSAAGFAKTGKDDTTVLLAGGGDTLLSSLGGLELVKISYTSDVVSPTSIMSLKSGASDASVVVCTLENAGFPKYLFYADDIVFASSAPHVANFGFGTDGKVTITIKALTGTAGLAGAASAYINATYPAAN